MHACIIMRFRYSLIFGLLTTLTDRIFSQEKEGSIQEDEGDEEMTKKK